MGGTENAGFYRAAGKLESEMPDIRAALNRLTLRLCDRLAAAAPDHADETSAPDPTQAMRLPAQAVTMIVLQERMGIPASLPRNAPLCTRTPH